MNFYLKKAVSAILSLSLFSSMFIPVSADDENDYYYIEPQSYLTFLEAQNKSYNSQVVHGNVNLSDLASVYEHLDFSEIEQIYTEFKSNCDNGYDEEEMLSDLNIIAYAVAYVQDMCQIANILYQFDTSDDNYFNELSYSQQIYYKAYDIFNQSVKYAAGISKYYKKLSDELGKESVDMYLSYDSSGSETEAAYSAKINEYVNQYYALINDSDSTEEQFADLYLEMVKYNNDYANNQVGTDYLQFSYDYMYSRDYTIDEAKKLCDSVAENMSALYNNISTDIVENPLWQDYMLLSYSEDELLDFLGSTIENISPEIKQAYDYMVDYQTYSIEPAQNDKNRAEGAFTTYFLSMDSPYIFINMNENYNDVMTFVHEFGHYNEMYQSGSSGSSLDLAEISSQALEFLYIPYYSQIYGEQYADLSEKMSVSNILWAVVSGCMIAEFETSVYENPDMTSEELITLYDDLETKYNLEEHINWYYVSHLFEQPGYYISYATSGIAAFEIWNTSLTDRQSAINSYIDLSSYGSSGNFREVLNNSGMNDIFEEQTMLNISGSISDKFLKAYNYDVDNSGDITAYDALIVLNVVVGNDMSSVISDISAADVDSDGSVTSADALLILQKVVSGE